MLKNAYSPAKIDADTAENELNFAEILPKIGNYPTVVLFAPAEARLFFRLRVGTADRGPITSLGQRMGGCISRTGKN